VRVLFLSENDVRQVLDLDELAEALRTALRSVSAGTASTPARVGALTGAGLLGAMPGYVPELGLGAKLVTYFRGNHARGVPGHQALIALFGVEDGVPLVLMGATHITGIRTAMTAAVAARALARPDARTLAILGLGVQGQAHRAAFTHLFSFQDVRVATRSAGDSFEDAVRGADVVCLCTDADEPVISASWLDPGAHVSSVGSGAEVDAGTLAAGSIFVESRTAATQDFPAGSRELAGRDPSSVTEVGEVLSGTHPGRQSADEITVYKSMGHASEDVAAATVVYRAALAAGIGTQLTI
jgi:ornithine cyclodeaminase/alanine dehydrogenase-like protein (mu-crystallin family)